jgi:hypothetical protein
VVWTLAAIPRKDLTFNQEIALEKYARGLERARQGEFALSKGWVNPGVFYEISKDGHARPVPWLPEGKPSYLKGKSLRGLLGERFPYLDDVYKDGAIFKIDSFNGDAGIVQKTARVCFSCGDEAFEIIPGGDHLIGTINFNNAPTSGQHVQGHSSSRVDPAKPALIAPKRPGSKQAPAGKPKRKTSYGQPQMH